MAFMHFNVLVNVLVSVWFVSLVCQFGLSVGSIGSIGFVDRVCRSEVVLPEALPEGLFGDVTGSVI